MANLVEVSLANVSFRHEQGRGTGVEERKLAVTIAALNPLASNASELARVQDNQSMLRAMVELETPAMIRLGAPRICGER